MCQPIRDLVFIQFSELEMKASGFCVLIAVVAALLVGDFIRNPRASLLSLSLASSPSGCSNASPEPDLPKGQKEEEEN